jgi:hypothetical protein
MISASVLAGTAYAADSSSVTHTQVISQLQQARAAGLLSTGEQEYPVAVNDKSTESRAEVLAELAAAGQPSVGEQVYPAAPAASSTESRAQVQSELAQYASSGVAPQIEH